MISYRYSRLLVVLFCISGGAAFAQEKEADACSEANQQAVFRDELIKAFGFDRYLQPVPPASWTMGKILSPERSCQVSCKSNPPYDNFYLSYKGYEASGKPCEGETSITREGTGLVKQMTACMAGCGGNIATHANNPKQ